MVKVPMTKLVAGLPSQVPFVGPEAQERARGKPFATRLGANENVFGPSPKAIAAMSLAASDCWQYADPENHDLKHALARHVDVTPDNIVVGEGIDALLGYLCRMFVAPGVKVVTSDGAYPTFNFHVHGYGGELVKVPYRDDCESPEALLRDSDGARLIYLANPDNPMGTMHGPDVIAAMISDLPSECMLVLDEAYCELANMPLLPTDVLPHNVIRFRTFSKAYGMAGARVGYGIGASEVISGFDKIRNHFGMSRISVAGALAALEDKDHLSRVLASVSDAKARIVQIAAENGVESLPSSTNFVTIDCGRDGDFARRVLAALSDRGVFVRMPFVAPQDRCIRVSAGTPEHLKLLAEALPDALKAADQVPQ